MTITHDDILLFHDAEDELLPSLEKLARAQHFPLLHSFLARAAEALRAEISLHPKHIRDQVPPFHNHLDLIVANPPTSPHSSLLLPSFHCLYQIGTLLVQDHYGKDWLRLEKGSPLQIAAFGAGCFPACAVASSQTPAQLADTGVLLSVLAFRISVYEQTLEHTLTIPALDWEVTFDDVQEVLNRPRSLEPCRCSQVRLVMIPNAVDLQWPDLRGLVSELLSAFQRKNHWVQAFNDTLAHICNDSKEIRLHHFYQGQIAGEIHQQSSSTLLKSAECLFNSGALSQPRHSSVPDRKQIAVVGYSGRFPDADNTDELWDILENGRDTHRRIPSDRFNIDTHYDPTGKKNNALMTQYGCFIKEPGLFDAQFFSVSPREAMQMDPVQRLGLITAFEALEMAGVVPNRTPSTQNNRIGVFYGQAGDDWRETNSCQKIDTYFIPGGIRAFTPGRINYFFKFSGPSYSIDTACSSSFAAIELACASLSRGECDTAIVGGVNVMTNPDIFAGLSKGHFLSTTGQSKSFDNEADGYCRADGVGTVILKRVTDAELDNDNIHALILGMKTNHSAEAASITRPDHAAQTALAQKILDTAGVNPDDIDYVEMHGTGTQRGDFHEMLSVTEVFTPPEKPLRSSPLYIGAVKSNIGHGEAAAGVTSLIKVLKMLEKGVIPPHVGIKSGKLNENFPNLRSKNIHIPMTSLPWLPRKDDIPRVVFLNNFSAAGGNTAMVLEEGKKKASTTNLHEDHRPFHVICVTGKQPQALYKNLTNLADYIAENSEAKMSDLSYTTTARRTHHRYRFAVNASDTATVQKALRSAAGNPVNEATNRKVAFVFTGQGKTYENLGKALFETFPLFKRRILQYNQLSSTLSFGEILPLIDSSLGDVTSANCPLTVQLATVCVQMALFDLVLSMGIRPVAVIGHSLGEYPACYAAGILSPSEVIYLVGSRAKLLLKNCEPRTYSMSAFKTSERTVREVLDTYPNNHISVACINSPEEIVLAGPKESVTGMESVLNQRGHKATPLDIPYAFHSTQMDPSIKEFGDIQHKLRRRESEGQPIFISSLLGRPVSNGEVDSTYFVRHMREPVQFFQAVISAEKHEIIDASTAWLEIGHHPVCSRFLKGILGSDIICTSTLRSKENACRSFGDALATLFTAGVPVDWNEYHRPYEFSNKLLNLPRYALDLKNHWIPYENNWTLHKGDSAQEDPNAFGKDQPSTLAVKKIVHETMIDDEISLLAITDLSFPPLRDAISGHTVRGSFLVPASFYVDICLALGTYTYKRAHDGQQPTGISVSSMQVSRSLTLNSDGSVPQILKTSAKMANDVVTLQFYTESPPDSHTVHAECILKYGDSQNWLERWKRNAHLVQNAINRLQTSQGAHVHRLGRNLVYQLFSTLVDYRSDSRGMDEVVLDTVASEAVATITYKATESECQGFVLDPRWVDNLCHVSGFVVNSDETKSDDEIYVSLGWDRFRLAIQPDVEKTYHSYVRMGKSGSKSKLRVGDVYILEGDQIVGLAEGVKFQSIPKRMLDHLLPSTDQKKSTMIRNTQMQIPHRGHLESTNELHSSPRISSSEKPKNGLAFSKVLDIIADECGCPPSELNDDAKFSTLGVDSLMSLTIISRVREELGVTLDSSTFHDYENVKALRMMMAAPPASSQIIESYGASSSGATSLTGTTAETLATSDTSHINSICDGKTIELVRSTVAQELGIDAKEIEDDTNLGDLGLDSLSVLSITALLKESLPKVVFPDDMLGHYTSINTLISGLNLNKSPVSSTKSKSKERQQVQKTPKTSNGLPLTLPPAEAKSYILQGNPNSSTRSIFYFPDGSGSATSYSPLGSIAPDVCVYSLSCPYFQTPDQWKNGVGAVVQLYLQEVRRRQPEGPYNLGGWSAGGTLAYEAAMQLALEGQRVDSLILLDAPCPSYLESLPSELFVFFDSIKALGDQSDPTRKESPPYLIPHFEATVRNLCTYRPRPFPCPIEEQPQMIVFWARYGVCDNRAIPRPPKEATEPWAMTWLLDARSDFGPNGWDKLVDRSRFTFETIAADHFSMMNRPQINELGKKIARIFNSIE